MAQLYPRWCKSRTIPRTAWLLAFFWFCVPGVVRDTNKPERKPGVAPLLIQSRRDRHCHRCNLLDRGLRRLEHVHEQPPNYTVTFTATTASTKQTINFTLTVNCTAKQLSLVKFTG
jgi:hypothetical protein